MGHPTRKGAILGRVSALCRLARDHIVGKPITDYDGTRDSLIAAGTRLCAQPGEGARVKLGEIGSGEWRVEHGEYWRVVR